MQDKISFVLWATRVFTIICTLLFVFPFTSYDPNALYQKALMASAATSALKLHQRMTNIPFQLNKEYLGRLIIEDSFHYLLYALIFLNVFPVTSHLNFFNFLEGPASMYRTILIRNFFPHIWPQKLAAIASRKTLHENKPKKSL